MQQKLTEPKQQQLKLLKNLKKQKKMEEKLSDLVNLQITELSVVVKNCSNWNKMDALERKQKINTR